MKQSKVRQLSKRNWSESLTKIKPELKDIHEAVRYMAGK